MLKFIKNETGVSAVLTALVMTVLLSFTALALDIGTAYVGASGSQNAADAIALSLGKYLPIAENDADVIALAKADACEYARKNHAENFSADNVVFNDLQDGKYRSLSVTVDKRCPTTFARIFGIDHVGVAKSATVSTVNVGAVSGAVPIGIVEQTYYDAVASGKTSHITLKVGGGEGDTGFYGFIVLDSSNGNAKLLEKWLNYGYDGTNYVGQFLPVATGNKTSAARNGVEYRLSLCSHYQGMGGCTTEHYVVGCPKIVYVLVYSFVESRTVEIVGFAPFLIEPSDKDDEIQGSFLNIVIPATEIISEKDFGLHTYRLTK